MRVKFSTINHGRKPFERQKKFQPETGQKSGKLSVQNSEKEEAKIS